MHLTGVGPILSRPALAAGMVAAGQPSRGNPQEPAGSDTGASPLHASGPQSYGVLDLSTLSTLPKTIASTAISGLDLGATIGAPRETASVMTRDSRTAATANVGTGNRNEPPPVLIGFRDTTVVRVVNELLDNIVAYCGREERGDLESFLDGDIDHYYYYYYVCQFISAITLQKKLQGRFT